MAIKTCSICGCPQKITYKEQDSSTGAIKYLSHTVQCGGHPGLSFWAWNNHPNYTKHHQWLTKYKQKTEGKKDEE